MSEFVPSRRGSSENRALFLAACLSANFLVGCTEGDRFVREGIPEFAVPIVTEEGGRGGGAALTVERRPMNGSGASGTITAMYSVDAFVVVLDAVGLPHPGEYASHVHLGRCAEQGEVLLTLNPVIGLADGTGESTTVLETEPFTASGPLSVHVHNQGGARIFCGDLGEWEP
jgi:hypothetical protein